MNLEARRESNRQYYDRIRNDPERWAAYLKSKSKHKAAYRRRLSDEQRERINWLQQKRRKQMSPEKREHMLAKRRETWAQIPDGDPRKERKRVQGSASDQRCRKRKFERLTDTVVANYYLRMRVGECPQELIELKREVIRLHRSLKHHPNNNQSA